MAILDRVKFDGLRSRNWIIYKHPSERLVFGTQLIVSEGQAAIFVKGGQVCDIFTPGSYILDSNNIPILQRFINIPYGGKTPFTAEIYFINTTTKLDVYWGTSDPIQLIDPKYFVKLRIRAFGQAGLKLKDYRLFFTELIGGMAQNDIVNYDKINNFYKAIVVTKVKTIIADTVIRNKISALEISPELENISQKVKERISDEFEKYGFSVVNFFISSINFPDEDFEKINKILEDRAAFEIMGDGRYATKRSFDVYEGAANNENGVAGAFAAGGVGIGAGLGIAKGLSDNVVAPGQNAGFLECPVCHAQVPSNSKFCSECGTAIEKPVVVCSKCGAKNPAGARFCSECGNNLAVKKCVCGTELEGNVKFCPNCGRKVE
ncbi:MAG: SPFH domain-containing protein [Clostridium sp.]|nr:SPFH domain-containing protein [Clostridium sp.]